MTRQIEYERPRIAAQELPPERVPVLVRPHHYGPRTIGEYSRAMGWWVYGRWGGQVYAWWPLPPDVNPPDPVPIEARMR